MAAKTARGGAREIVTFVWPIAGPFEPWATDALAYPSVKMMRWCVNRPIAAPSLTPRVSDDPDGDRYAEKYI